MTREWTIPLPYVKPPLTLNSRLHWANHARITEALVGVGIVYTRKLRIPPLEKFTAVLHYEPSTIRGRDADNLAPTVKPVVDGMCRANRIQDTADHYIPAAPVIHPATGKPGRLWLVVVDLS